MNKKLNNPLQQLDYDTVTRAIDVIPSNIFFKDRELRYRFTSHYWTEIEGDDIIGKTDLEVRKDQENVESAMEADREILRSGKGCRYTIRNEVDGVEKYLELLKEPVFNDAGEAIGIVGLINNVTDKVTLENKLRATSKELEEQLAELERRNATQRMFTASINHELRSPLNGIIGILQILSESEGLSDEQMELVENAYQTSHFLLEIVNDLLDFSKMETNDFTIHADEFDLRDVVTNVSQTMSKLASEKGLAFRVDIQDKTYCKLIGDDVRVKQVMYNILSNGIKYTEQGSVTLGLSYKAGRLHIECTDTGQGIATESIDKLFDPYVRLAENRNKYINGTGLGLSIVDKLIKRMNGEIQVRSEVNRGTTFELIIPLSVYDDTVYLSDEKTVERVKVSGDIKISQELKVLCIDDTAVNHKVFKGLLRDSNILVDSAMSGMEGLKMAKETKYDLIFIDYHMPEMGGTDTLKALRTVPGINSNTKTVLLTANIGPEYEEEALRVGFNRFLTKPVMKPNLLRVIAELIAE